MTTANQYPIYPSKRGVCLFVRLSLKVLKPRSLSKLSLRTRGPKNYLGPQSHTFTSLLTESRGLKNYSGLQSHTFTSLLTESRVLSPDQSRSQVPTPRLQITYWGAYGQRVER
jgi:hypothetical protein